MDRIGNDVRCCTHDKLCRRCGPVQSSEGLLRILAAGSPCVDFSTMGDLLGFNGQTALAFLVLMKLVLTSRPDVFLFENVRGFPISALQDILKHLYDSDETMLCPSSWGFPVKRDRRYALFRLRSSVQSVIPLREFAEQSHKHFQSAMRVADVLCADLHSGCDELSASQSQRC